MDQLSDEWHAARLGKATASRIADILRKTKSGPAASRQNYLAELVAERLTGNTAANFTNAAMQWGTETEPLARAAYEFETGADVELVGFVDHPSVAMSGASPDGLVGSNGLLEIKAPNTATHIDTLLNGTIKQDYLIQMQWQMACTGRQWCDFCSFDPRVSENLKLWVKRIHRDDDWIAQIEAEVRTFLDDVTRTVERLEAIGREVAA